MTITRLTKEPLLRKALFACGLTVFLCLADSARATLVPEPLICFTDNNGNPTVTTANLDEILDPANSSPTITYGFETIELQFYVFSVFAPVLGQRAVIITGPGSVPDQIVILTVNQLLGKNSVDIYFADYTAANFAATVAAWAGSPTVAETGSELDVTKDLNLNPGDGPEICVDCGGAQVPDSGPTWALLGLSLAAVTLLYRRMRPQTN